MSKFLVTAALPYANGSLHLGHLLEYCQADIYVRALKRLGEDALYVCASDAHGTPIEVNATRLGITPEALVERVHGEQTRDFARYDIAFDVFSTTHSETNRTIVERVYAQLRAGGHLEDRKIDGNWCETDQRFLPDRFIKGTCPRCGAKDQYGDVCEACGATYEPTELKEPHCILCGKPPVVRKSEHVFFKLSDPKHVAFLRQWIDSGVLQPDVANYVRNWVEGGLKDWCISRDGPYFGFTIPDRKNKFFYVWLDAPFGYVSSSLEWGERHGLSLDALWKSKSTRIEHIIGKDIVYFHTLFWPAVLHAIGYTLPSLVQVHGMLTINGEKMSKTRGTFINAATFAEHIDPQALRYYYASKYSSTTDDLDLSFNDFVLRVNSELVNKHANLFSRTAQFLSQRLDGRLGDLPFSPQDAQAEPTGDGSLVDLARRVVAACRRVEALYRRREFGQAMRELCAVADIGNELMQARQPWEEMKRDPEKARETCTFAANVCHALAMYLWPVVPRFAEAGARGFGAHIERMDPSALFRLRKAPIGEFERLAERVERKACDAVAEASHQNMPATAAAAATAPVALTIDDFRKLDLRVGVVVAAEPVPKSNKLLKLRIDVGEPEPRQVVAGIALAYPPEQLVGRRVVVVVNLAPAKIMGVESRGMVLASGDGEALAVVSIAKDLPAGSRVR